MPARLNSMLQSISKNRPIQCHCEISVNVSKMWYDRLGTDVRWSCMQPNVYEQLELASVSHNVSPLPCLLLACLHFQRFAMGIGSKSSGIFAPGMPSTLP